MKTLKLISALALALAFTSCDSDSVPESVAGPTNNIAGRVIHVQGRLDVSQARGSNAVVVFRKHSVIPDANGLYEINDTLAGNASSARMLEAGVNDTVRIVIGKDTLREIPVNSWSNILPTNYIVQRNISAVVKDSFAQSKLEAVWWSNDSIAHVMELGKATTATKYSGYIYSVYDDSMFAAKAPLYSLLVRVRSATSASVDSIKAASNTVIVTAITGDLGFDADQFVSFNRRFIVGSALTPRDSSVSVWSSSRTLIMKLDTLTVSDTMMLDSAHTGINWISFQHSFDSAGNYVSSDSTIIRGNASMTLQAADWHKYKGTAKYNLALRYSVLDSIHTNINADTLSTEIKHSGLVSALDSNGVHKEFIRNVSNNGVVLASAEPLTDIKVYLITKTIKVFYAVIKD